MSSMYSISAVPAWRGAFISPAQGPGWCSPGCIWVLWREEDSATSALSHRSHL
jgi:hypothetical protein